MNRVTKIVNNDCPTPRIHDCAVLQVCVCVCVCAQTVIIGASFCTGGANSHTIIHKLQFYM